MKKAISRRDFLKVVGVSAAALGMTACGGSSASTSTSTAASTAASSTASSAVSEGLVLEADSVFPHPESMVTLKVAARAAANILFFTIVVLFRLVISPVDQSFFQNRYQFGEEHGYHGEQENRCKYTGSVKLRHHSFAEISESALSPQPFGYSRTDNA